MPISHSRDIYVFPHRSVSPVDATETCRANYNSVVTAFMAELNSVMKKRGIDSTSVGKVLEI